MECFQPTKNLDGKLYPAQLRDDAFYETRCEAGHTTSTVLQEHRFEWLSELAINAIIDGYYREAVASFAASLERFQEYSVRVIASKDGLTVDQFDNSWKYVVRHSERQLGAYIMSYCFEFQRVPPLLPKR